MDNTFKISGLSFKNTPLEIREKLALNELESKELMRFLNENANASDLMVLSTCNRTEIYYNHPQELSKEIALGLSLIKGIDGNKIQKYLTNQVDSAAATNHLFEVAMGLDAQVVGDIQISNQVKNAYQWSADNNMAGPFLHRLMHTIFFANKRVIQETAFRDGAASVSYATKELIQDITSELKDPKILLLGLGEIGQDVCRNYIGSSKKVTIANRSREKANALALESGFPVIDFNRALHSLEEFDVVVSSVSKSEPIITKDLLSKIDILTHKFFIDLSVPRSIDSSIEDIHGVLVYNIDNIQSKASEALNKRIDSIPAVRNIIKESLADFTDWSKELTVSPTIKKLKNALETIRQEEIKRHLKSEMTAEAKIIDAVTKSMMQKIIKLPVLQLKAACKRGEAETLIDVLNDLFDLDKTEVPTSK